MSTENIKKAVDTLIDNNFSFELADDLHKEMENWNGSIDAKMYIFFKLSEKDHLASRLSIAQYHETSLEEAPYDDCERTQLEVLKAYFWALDLKSPLAAQKLAVLLPLYDLADDKLLDFKDSIINRIWPELIREAIYFPEEFEDFFNFFINYLKPDTKESFKENCTSRYKSDEAVRELVIDTLLSYAKGQEKRLGFLGSSNTQEQRATLEKSLNAYKKALDLNSKKAAQSLATFIPKYVQDPNDVQEECLPKITSLLNEGDCSYEGSYQEFYNYCSSLMALKVKKD